jgi:hypothetical protein
MPQGIKQEDYIGMHTSCLETIEKKPANVETHPFLKKLSAVYKII